MTDLKSIEERANPYDNDVKELIAIAKWAKEARDVLEITLDFVDFVWGECIETNKAKDCLSRFPMNGDGE